MTAQIVEIAGQKMVMLPMGDYERLIDIAEDKEDALVAAAAEQRRLDGEEYLPADIVDQILQGQSPLRAWRKHRCLTLDELAQVTGSRKSTLSEIENGKAQGKPSLWRALALALDVTVDDILPTN